MREDKIYVSAIPDTGDGFIELEEGLRIDEIASLSIQTDTIDIESTISVGGSAHIEGTCDVGTEFTANSIKSNTMVDAPGYINTMNNIYSVTAEPVIVHAEHATGATMMFIIGDSIDTRRINVYIDPHIKTKTEIYVGSQVFGSRPPEITLHITNDASDIYVEKTPSLALNEAMLYTVLPDVTNDHLIVIESKILNFLTIS